MTRHLIIVSVLALSAVPASAAISTYLGIGPDISGPGVYVEDGIVTTSASGLFWGWPEPGQVHLDPEGFAGNEVTITLEDGRPFFAEGLLFDISFKSNGFFDVDFLDEDGALMFSFPLNSAQDYSFVVPRPACAYEPTKVYGATIRNSVEHFSFDNVRINDPEFAVCPEPAHLGLFGVAAGALFLRRRQRSR